MTAIVGKNGKVKQGTNELAYVESWELSISDEALETTGLGATARTYVGRGLPENTGTVTWRALDNSGTGEAAIRSAALAGTSVALDLYESATKYWKIEAAYITSFSQTVNVDELVSGSFEFTISGAPEYT
jgi:hypothetical protein